VPGAFFAGSPSSAASVFESNNSVTLTFYSIPPEALGANFKKIKLFCVVGLHGFWRCGIFLLSLRFIEVSWIFGLFFDDHHTGGLEKTKEVAGRFPHMRGDGSTAERTPTQSDAKFISPHAWGLLSVSSWNIRSTETLGAFLTLPPWG
jgi:hypothetical protein